MSAETSVGGVGFHAQEKYVFWFQNGVKMEPKGGQKWDKIWSKFLATFLLMLEVPFEGKMTSFWCLESPKIDEISVACLSFNFHGFSVHFCIVFFLDNRRFHRHGRWIRMVGLFPEGSKDKRKLMCQMYKNQGGNDVGRYAKHDYLRQSYFYWF